MKRLVKSIMQVHNFDFLTKKISHTKMMHAEPYTSGLIIIDNYWAISEGQNYKVILSLMHIFRHFEIMASCRSYKIKGVQMTTENILPSFER